MQGEGKFKKLQKERSQKTKPGGKKTTECLREELRKKKKKPSRENPPGDLWVNLEKRKGRKSTKEKQKTRNFRKKWVTLITGKPGKNRPVKGRRAARRDSGKCRVQEDNGACGREGKEKRVWVPQKKLR